MQNQGQAEEDDNEHDKEENADTDADQTSPGKDEGKTCVKHEADNKDEAKITKEKEASEINALEERTDKSEAKSSVKDSLKIEGVGAGEKGSVSVSINAVDNKKNETKGDAKQSLCSRAVP